MNFEQRNILCDLEIVKEKIDDVITSFTWFDDEYFTHEPNHVLTNKEIYIRTDGNITSIVSKIHKQLT